MTKDQRKQFEDWLTTNGQAPRTAQEYARMIAWIFSVVPHDATATQVEEAVRLYKQGSQHRVAIAAWSAYSRFLVALGAAPLRELFPKENPTDTAVDGTAPLKQIDPLARASSKHRVYRCPCCTSSAVNRATQPDDVCWMCWIRLWSHEAKQKRLPPPTIDPYSGFPDLKPITDIYRLEHPCAGLLAVMERAKATNQPFVMAPICIPHLDYAPPIGLEKFFEKDQTGQLPLATVFDNTAIEGTEQVKLELTSDGTDDSGDPLEKIVEVPIAKPKKGPARRVPYLPYSVTLAIWTIRNPRGVTEFPIGHKRERFPWRVIPDLMWHPGRLTQDNEWLFHDITGKTRHTSDEWSALRVLQEWGGWVPEIAQSGLSIPLVASAPRSQMPASAEIIKASLIYWEKERGFKYEGEKVAGRLQRP